MFGRHIVVKPAGTEGDGGAFANLLRAVSSGLAALAFDRLRAERGLPVEHPEILERYEAMGCPDPDGMWSEEPRTMVPSLDARPAIAA